MTITDVYNKYKGQSLLVPGADPADAGQCVQAADYFMHEAYGLPYVWLNAIDWWKNPDANLKANFDFIPYSPSMPVKYGDFVIYGAGVGSPYGHVDVVAQDGVGNNYVGYDSNWGHSLTLHTVNHNDSYNQYILGILRNKSNNVDMTATSEQLQVIYYMAFPNQAVNMDWVKAWTGKDMSDAVNALRDDPSRQSYVTKLVNESAAYEKNQPTVTVNGAPYVPKG